MSRRLDAADTVDVAMGTLVRLQREGWAVKQVAWDVDHKKGIPVESTLTVRLVPAKP